jgi:hypothetical protein
MVMGFFDKIKKAISGGKEKTDEVKVATKKGVDETAKETKQAGNKAEKAADNASDASDELKKE